MCKLMLLFVCCAAVVLSGCTSSVEEAASKVCGGPFVREVKLAKESKFNQEEAEVICNDGTKHRVRFE